MKGPAPVRTGAKAKEDGTGCARSGVRGQTRASCRGTRKQTYFADGAIVGTQIRLVPGLSPDRQHQPDDESGDQVRPGAANARTVQPPFLQVLRAHRVTKRLFLWTSDVRAPLARTAAEGG